MSSSKSAIGLLLASDVPILALSRPKSSFCIWCLPGFFNRTQRPVSGGYDETPQMSQGAVRLLAAIVDAIARNDQSDFETATEKAIRTTENEKHPIRIPYSWQSGFL